MLNTQKDFFVPVPRESVVRPGKSFKNVEKRKNPVRNLLSPEPFKSALSEFSDVKSFSYLGEVDLDDIQDFSNTGQRRRRKDTNSYRNLTLSELCFN